MSKKYKSQKHKKKRVPWLLLALGGMLVVIAATMAPVSSY